MARKGERLQTIKARLDGQLFIKLADNGLFGTFPVFNLAAWKLPKTRMILAVGPLRDQHAPVCINQRAGGDPKDRAFELSGLKASHER